MVLNNYYIHGTSRHFKKHISKKLDNNNKNYWYFWYFFVITVNIVNRNWTQVTLICGASGNFKSSGVTL